MVYIREAHPEDEWQLETNTSDDVVLAQPTTFSERRTVANRCSVALRLTMPVVVDDMNNTVDNAYAAWPERLFIFDTDGLIASAGTQDPARFYTYHIVTVLFAHPGPPLLPRRRPCLLTGSAGGR